MTTLRTLGLLAGLALIPGLGTAADRSNTARPAGTDSPATIAYGPPVVYYGGDWERPRGTHRHQQAQIEKLAQAKARAAQSELASAQWQERDYGQP